MGAGGKLVVVGAAFVFFASGVHAKHHNPLAVLESFGATPAGAVSHGAMSSGPAVRLGYRMAAGYGWHGSQDTCLNELWTHESGWRWNAQNPTSPAYGIPQADPGDKMAAAGSDWQTNPVTQIRWGLTYIRDNYHTPCGAWSFEMSHYPNWY